MKMVEQILNFDFTYFSVKLNEIIGISTLQKNYFLSLFMNMRNTKYV